MKVWRKNLRDGVNICSNKVVMTLVSTIPSTSVRAC
jgi:hypothetical protein